MTATSPLGDWIRAQGERVRVAPSVDPVSDRSSATCGAADRTIYATRAIAPGDVLAELRNGAFLSGSAWLAGHVETALGADESAKLKAQLAELQPSGTVLTALALLAEKARGARSAFHGYIQQLPEAVPLPLAWSAAAKAMLHGTAAFPIIDDGLVRSVFDRFATPLTSAFPSLWSADGVSFASFRWAFSIVSSRAFSVSDAREPTLLPVIDMANHEPADPAAVIRKDPESGGYALVALRAVDADAPVTISYGELSNAQLLCRYGFTLPEPTPSDAVLVSSAHVRAVFALLTNGGSADAALAQLDRLAQEEEEEEEAEAAHVAAAAASTSESAAPAVKRRKLFGAAKAAEEEEPAVSFALHGDVARDFGLGDGLLDFVLARGLPADALYDVLSVLLQHKDKRYSALLAENEKEENKETEEEEERRLARALAALERQVARRVLLGIMSLEEASEEEESGEEENEEEEEDDDDE